MTQSVDFKAREFANSAIDLIAAKNHDYSSPQLPFSNFTLSGYMTRFFADRGAQNETLGFVNLIGTKLARLTELLNNKQPKNESIDDTFKDLVNYVLLWREWYVSDGKTRTN